MRRTGTANLPLHTGKAPPWLFKRMVKLAGAISEAVVQEYGRDEFLRRLADPYWFQGFGCVIGFDWHSSGLTTTACGALKTALDNTDTGVKAAGGKGAASRKAPAQITGIGDIFSLSTKKVDRLKYSSQMSAKVDNSLVQDNHQLYQHSFFVTEKGRWAVIQQGLDESTNYARRYHWLSSNVDDPVCEPHDAICGDKKNEAVLDMTSRHSRETRKASLDIVRDGEFRHPGTGPQSTITDFFGPKPLRFTMKRGHGITDMKKTNIETLKRAYEYQPRTYEELVALKGVGPKTIRALALMADIIHGKQASWKDPVKYSFAVGGKDGVPYPVDRKVYDQSAKILHNAVRQARLGDKDRAKAIRRLEGWI